MKLGECVLSAFIGYWLLSGTLMSVLIKGGISFHGFGNSLPLMSMFTNNALLGVRVWISEQRKFKRRSKVSLT